MLNQRASGILLHITSLPSSYGIGDLGPAAYQFVDFLVKTNQRYWQILPINPTDGINGHSPYSSYSAYAGNPLLISPDRLCQDGFMTKKELGKIPKFRNGGIEYPLVVAWKEKILALAFKKFRSVQQQEEFSFFCESQQKWLDDYAVYSVAKLKFGARSWNDWPKGIRLRVSRDLEIFKEKFADDLLKYRFEQFLFYKQYRSLKAYCNEKNIKLIGDMPIYVNYDSVDVWTHPKLFKLDKKLKPKFVSGVPPDYFSKTGQRWGNPVYDWTRMKKTGYEWWINRIEHSLTLFDFLRIDHFRGFAGFWQIPAHEKIAVFGRWVKAPGIDFFRTLLKKLGKIPIIAEDLGYITPDVIHLLQRFKLPGMRVLLFAFDDYSKGNPHHPENYPKHCVAYTGTHDNNTVQGWFQKDASWNAKGNVMKHLNQTSGKDIHWGFIKIVMNSAAQTAIIPLQDILGLGDDARVNRPATTYHNWEWRFKTTQLKTDIIRKLIKLTKLAKRESS
jgi:4-alpha-glucanotransferase